MVQPEIENLEKLDVDVDDDDVDDEQVGTDEDVDGDDEVEPQGVSEPAEQEQLTSCLKMISANQKVGMQQEIVATSLKLCAHVS